MGMRMVGAGYFFGRNCMIQVHTTNILKSQINCHMKLNKNYFHGYY